MWRFTMYLLLAVALLSVGPGRSSAAASGQGTSQAGQSQAEPGEVSATIPMESGDPVWLPTKDQLSGWVSDGMKDAGSGTDFLAIPVVQNMTWVNLEGTPLPDDRSLRFAALVTPRLGAIVYGYAQAWDETTWGNYQQDPTGVTDGLGADLMPAFNGSELLFPIAIQGSAMDDMEAAVFYAGRWWYAEPTTWGGMDAFTADSVAEPSPTARWVGEYLMAQEATQPALQPPENTTVYAVQWLSAPLQPPDEKFVAALPSPAWTGTDNVRLAIGTVDTYAWIDFDLMR